MITTVVVPLDGSALAASALGPSQALADATGAVLRLVTVLPMTLWEDRVRDARDHLDEQADRLGIERVEVAVITDQGIPEAIVAESNTVGAVVCMATHGRGGLGHAVLGSVAEAVLRHSQRPLLLVGPSVEAGPIDFTNGNLLVTVDGSKTSEVIVPAAAEWASLLHLRSWVVQVLPAPIGVIVKPHDHDAEAAELRRIAGELPDTEAPPQSELLHGSDPAAFVLDYASRLPATLMAMATHGRTGLARVALGSVAMQVVHHSRCPILVVRSPDLVT